MLAVAGDATQLAKRRLLMRLDLSRLNSTEMLLIGKNNSLVFPQDVTAYRDGS